MLPKKRYKNTQGTDALGYGHGSKTGDGSLCGADVFQTRTQITSPV